jgi:hypothetical protein
MSNHTFHPSKANIQFPKDKLIESSDALIALFSAGLTEADLKPVDWSTNDNPVGRRLTTPVRNQQQCGNCWAMSSTDALTDKFIVQAALAGKKVGSGSLKLQPAMTTQCVPEIVDKGCGGGAAYFAGKYFETMGCPEITGKEPTWTAICPDGCTDIPTCANIQPQFGNSKIWKAKPNSTVYTLAAGNPDGSVDIPTTILNIKKALINGPVVGQLFCTNDFMYDNLTCEVWRKTGGIFINGSYNKELDDKYPDKKLGAQWADIQMEDGIPSSHAVEVVGWGKDTTWGDYWIVKNTWGDKWNGDGFFKYGMYGGGGSMKFSQTTNGVPNNKYTALDIPVTDAIQASTGKILKSEGQAQGSDVGNLFGSCLSFEIEGELLDDESYLSYKDNIQGRITTSTKKHKNTFKIILKIAIIIFVLIFLYFLFRKINKNK